ncbi:MAG: NADH dehydrogenase (quinone) subunit D [Caldilineae bacterium]|nr:MAG: NADH dehydrogenase (quinone) subunit D [Caldilineae bacterium]
MADTPFDRLQSQFPDAVVGQETFREQTTITLKAEHLPAVARFLRDDPALQYNLLLDVYGVDRRDLGLSPRFAVTYELYSIPHNRHLRLSVPLADPPAGNDALPRVASVTGVWPTANWLERETFDLMGIEFTGHPWLRRILLPVDWVGHPLRKDYPLGGEAVYFSHDRDDPRFAHLGKQIMAVPSYHSELEEGVDTEGHLVLNMGPQHPATHGVLRLAVELDGERVLSVKPEVGYLHSGFEKTGENKRYEKFIPYCDRMDYVAAMSNNLGYVLAVEKLLGVEIPEHAQYARVILTELQRIASHMVWLGTHALDVSGTIHALLMYAFYWREQILDIFEMVCGARMTTSYFCVGGLRWPLPGAFRDAVQHFLDGFPEAMKDFHGMLTKNPVWRSRLEGVGVLSKEDAIALGITGPLLRGSGVKLDWRKAQPYSSYDHFDFDIPTSDRGDCYGRYLVRMEELRQSLRIIEQALKRLKPGPHKTSDRKVVLPPREEISQSMESLIHHFKLVTEGFKPPRGQVYGMVENPKGILGFGLISDGSAVPYRLRVRGPSFVNLQATDIMARQGLLSDIVTIIGSIDIVLGEVDR